jgi:hypothetical protein
MQGATPVPTFTHERQDGRRDVKRVTATVQLTIPLCDIEELKANLNIVTKDYTLKCTGCVLQLSWLYHMDRQNTLGDEEMARQMQLEADADMAQQLSAHLNGGRGGGGRGGGGRGSGGGRVAHGRGGGGRGELESWLSSGGDTTTSLSEQHRLEKLRRTPL